MRYLQGDHEVRPWRLYRSGRLKKEKNEPPGRKERKENYAFSIGVADGDRTMSKMLNIYKWRLHGLIEKLHKNFIRKYTQLSPVFFMQGV